MFRTCFPLALGLQAILLASPASAQYQTADGFAAEALFREVPYTLRVRGVAFDRHRGAIYEAIDNVLYCRPDANTMTPVRTLPLPDDIGTVRFCDGNGRIYFTARNAGTVFEFDPGTQGTNSVAGVANGFDLAVDSHGAMLLAANPNWPQPNSNGGIWQIGRGAPRQILQLLGPSAPLTFDRHDNLITAEVGTVVPPLPGTVRLLRFPAARVAAVLASASAQLTLADADAIGAGYSGAFGLAVDDLDRVYVTDPGSLQVTRTRAGTLLPEATPFCTLPGYGLQLQFVSSFGDPWRAMRAWQPGEQCSSLLVCSSDYSSEFLLTRLHPERPRLGVATGNVVAPGSVQFDCSGAPPQSLLLLAFAPPTTAPEAVISTIDATPIWLGLPPASLVVAATTFADASGAARIGLWHPGGFAAALQVQMVALSAPGSGRHATSAPLPLMLLR